jgi:hypothetical protein
VHTGNGDTGLLAKLGQNFHDLVFGLEDEQGSAACKKDFRSATRPRRPEAGNRMQEQAADNPGGSVNVQEMQMEKDHR